ncbi:MFS transporter [Phocicoccus pinnipedialis]|uniref:Multidrug resistance protein MdtG n=1 Tax=Phocicoccus pinnipedialis TaxID=110845 RepID=A0A6V7R3V8_9BACL|nr:MFS transporter [Jeotgalicoccus pinnipedialis]MBP1940032.1 MFS family permease [Jeotgalicoccus pinnipedialis]CAD2072020.1 Multidrug resistance protein MdtG [Jeotgalicoccus pinnipedialis]
MSVSEVRSRIFTLEFIIVFIFHFILMFSMYTTLVTVSGVSMEKYGIGPSLAGFVASVFILGILSGRAVSGNLINKVGVKNVVWGGVAMFFLTYAFYFLDYGLIFLIIVRLLNGFATGYISTALNTLATIILPKDRRGEGISYFSLSLVLASSIGPFASFTIFKDMSFNQMLVIVGIIMAVTTVLFLFVKTNNSYSKYRNVQFKVIDKKAAVMAPGILILGFTQSTIFAFIGTYTILNGYVLAASLFFIVYSAATMLTRPITGRILDQKGSVGLIITTIIFNAIGYYILGGAISDWMVLVSAAVIGLGMGNYQSIAQATCVELGDKDNIGLSTSTFFISLEIGLGFGPLILGLIAGAVGYGQMYQLMVLPIAIALIHFIIFVKPKLTRPV